MAIKFEAIVFTDNNGQLAAAVTLSKNLNGYTQQEMDIAQHIKRSVDEMFKNRFEAQPTVIPCNEENTNVH